MAKKKIPNLKAQPRPTDNRNRFLQKAARAELREDERSADPVDAVSWADSRREIRIGLDEDAMIAHLDEKSRLEYEAEIASFEAQEAFEARSASYDWAFAQLGAVLSTEAVTHAIDDELAYEERVAAAYGPRVPPVKHIGVRRGTAVATGWSYFGGYRGSDRDCERATHARKPQRRHWRRGRKMGGEIAA